MSDATALPDGPREARDVALRALDASPDGWLALPERRRLRRAYGPWTPPDGPGGPDAGLLRRAELLAACVERALLRWDERFPTDRRPHDVVATVMPALRGEVAEADLDQAVEALRRDVDPLGSEPGAEDAFTAGFAAVRLFSEAWDGEPDAELHPEETTLDTDFDEPPVDALAAHALVFGDPAGARKFWRWYVTEAFPAAYRAVPDDGG